MPLWRSTSRRAFRHNIRAELAAGRPIKQALAVAYDVGRRAAAELRRRANARRRGAPVRPGSASR